MFCPTDVESRLWRRERMIESKFIRNGGKEELREENWSTEWVIKTSENQVTM